MENDMVWLGVVQRDAVYQLMQSDSKENLRTKVTRSIEQFGGEFICEQQCQPQNLGRVKEMIGDLYRVSWDECGCSTSATTH